MHHFLRQFRGLPILRKKYHLMPFAPRLFENFDASAPGSFLAVVDFPQVEHLPLHDTLRGTPSVLHDAPVALCHPSREACSAKTCRHCAWLIPAIMGVGLFFLSAGDLRTNSFGGWPAGNGADSNEMDWVESAQPYFARLAELLSHDFRRESLDLGNQAFGRIVATGGAHRRSYQAMGHSEANVFFADECVG